MYQRAVFLAVWLLSLHQTTCATVHQLFSFLVLSGQYLEYPAKSLVYPICDCLFKVTMYLLHGLFTYIKMNEAEEDEEED